MAGRKEVRAVGRGAGIAQTLDLVDGDETSQTPKSGSYKTPLRFRCWKIACAAILSGTEKRGGDVRHPVAAPLKEEP